MSNGLCISPAKENNEGLQPSQSRSLRDVVHDIDNDRDLKAYVSSFASKVSTRNADARYGALSVSLLPLISKLLPALIPISLIRHLSRPQTLIPFSNKIRYKVDLRWRAAKFLRIVFHPHNRPSIRKINPIQTNFLSLCRIKTEFSIPFQQDRLPFHLIIMSLIVSSPLHTIFLIIHHRFILHSKCLKARTV